MNKIACIGGPERARLFRETANRLDLPESLVEKDFWVCWVLKQLFSIERFSGKLLFKGGTSLSKVFGAINRFSEDIDLAVDYAGLGFTGSRDPRRQNLSRTKQNALLTEMLQTCQRYIGGEFLSEFRTRCIEVLGREADWSVGLDGLDPNVVQFRYPKALRQHTEYVAPQVVLELGTHAEFVPRDEFRIRSLVAAEFADVFDDPEVRVTALLAKRTFWEKATILHAEYHRPLEKALPGRYSRHYYDTAMLARGTVGDEALADLTLLADVVRHKQLFYPSAWARYDLAVPGSLALAPVEYRVAALKQDYRDMEMMIFGAPPSFESVITTLRELERELNSRADG